MADLAIIVLGVANASDFASFEVDGNAIVGNGVTGTFLTWTTPPVSYNALAATINAAIKDAAITAAAAAGFSVGALDKKTLFGGAVGL